MTIKASSISGCCISFNLYDLGGAHGIPVSENQDEFDKLIKVLLDRYASTASNGLFVALTNSGQQQIREYLKTQGWDVIEHSYMHNHSIERGKLKQYFLDKARKKAEEEAAKKAEEEAKKTAEKKEPFKGKVYLKDIQEIIGATGSKFFKRWIEAQTTPNKVRFRVTINNHYGIEINPLIEYANWQHLRDHVYELVHQARAESE